MTRFFSNLLYLSIFFSLLLSTISNNNNTTTVYEILTQYGLPSGLLPDSVTDYTFDLETGKFTVALPKPCYIHFDYLVYYDKKITGTLKIGSITNLQGIEVKKLFLWLDVDEIRVDLPPSDSIYFKVGFINKKLDVDQFQTVHSCKDNELGFPSLLKVPTATRELPTLLTE
ncbi:transmembrane protein, putative (Protein of unknown function, DUF538) [Thalictrum thalictroides]|uniref:Transmembrane protein n=1 Tax=Thalictrum thalictroides TaxID=46969 RepID=A0A7J6WL49_THATH|nr:transmembrane protein, putative (Protein of unknown function, DUF538) [Thalictrum thalictroides]